MRSIVGLRAAALFQYSKLLLAVYLAWHWLGALNDRDDIFATFPHKDLRLFLFSGLGLMLSILIASRHAYRWPALISAIELVLFFSEFPNLASVAMGYIVFLLFCLSCTQAPTLDENTWSMPKRVSVPLWGVFGLVYLDSAISKIHSLPWMSGDAMGVLLKSSFLTRDNFVVEFLIRNPRVGFGLTVFAVAVELLFLPLMLGKASRQWVLALSALLHLGIMSLFAVEYISVGILIFHLFLFVSLLERP